MLSTRSARIAAPTSAAVLLAALLAFGLRGRGIDDPIEFDPIVYLTVGSNALHGALPYRDIFDHKGPLTYWLYAGIDLVSAGSAGVRIVLLASFLASAALLADLVRRRADRAATWAATLVYGLAGSSEAFVAQSPNLEQMLLPAMVGAVWAAERAGEHRGLAWAATSGAALGVLVACKPSFGLLALVCVGVAAGRGPRRAAAVVVMGGAGAAIVALSLLPFVLAGALADVRFGLITSTSATPAPRSAS